jgi:ribosomal protein S18 acetylase RimI-like enzyme
MPKPPERLLEHAELELYRDFYRALPSPLSASAGISVTPDAGPDAPPVLGPTHFRAVGFDHPMFNRTMGIVTPEAAATALSEAREHFAAAGIRRWMLQVAPDAEDAGFRAAAAAAGLVRLRGWARHVGRADDAARTGEARRATDLELARIGAEDAEPWARIVVESFRLPEAFVPWLAALAHRPGWHLYLARHRGDPVASAALFLPDAEGLAHLTFAGTRPEFRGRGAQSALVALRIADARAMGARWIVSETDENLPDRPNPSTRNLLRLGLPVLYVRANWGPPPP